MNDSMSRELPDLFRFENGERVRSREDWRRRRQELLELVLTIEYGHLPPAPPGTAGEELHTHEIPSLWNARHSQYRLVTAGDRPFSFLLHLLVPAGDGPFPVFLDGDDCWRDVADDIAREVIRRGYILAEFNRVEIVPDNLRADRTTGLYRVWPEGDYGALAAWAWAYHRCVDFLLSQPFVDAARIGVTGASRGGKTALLAGATDERIALTSPAISGCGGAGCFRWPGPQCERLADILKQFPYWFSPRLKEFIGKEYALPFDQHALKALVAPRALISAEALGDLWANPTGTWQTYQAAREMYRFLGAEERIGISYRPGPHEHNLTDWTAQLDFADWQLRGKPPARPFDVSPFPDLPPAFSWSAPPATPARQTGRRP